MAVDATLDDVSANVYFAITLGVETTAVGVSR